MAAKKKKVTKAGPDLSNRVLELSDLPKKEQADAVSLVSGVSETMPQSMQKLAERHIKSSSAGMQAKGQRYTRAASAVEAKPVTMEGMIEARKSSFHNAAAGEARLPNESVAGQEFYFENRRHLDETVGDSPFSIPQIVDATGRLSVQTTPESEKSSLRALSQAHTTGKVHFSEQLIGALESVKAPVPESLHGTEAKFSEVPGSVVRGMTEPSIRGTVEQHTTDVNVGDMAKTSMRTNLQYAHEALQGVRPVSPTGNPKLFSYGRAHELATPDSPEHMEYQLRARHIGRVARGEESSKQMMLDFDGLRSSNEGVLSNQLQTPNDSWMLANMYQQKPEVFKVAGDVNLTAKTGKTKRGRELSVGKGNPNITPAGIQHAVGNAATTGAAKAIQQDLDLDFTVPSMLVQESVWAADRRTMGEDAAYNAARREATPKKERIKKSKDRQLPGMKGF